MNLPQPPVASRGKRKASGHLSAAIRYIHEHYAEEISLETLAKNVFVSAYYLSHLFREEMGVTFSDYLSKVRMEKTSKARILLRTNTSM